MRRIAVFLLLLVALPALAQERIDLKLDVSEAEAVLAILGKRAAGQSVGEADWQALFNTLPYQRLKKREASLHRDFTDQDFQQFVATLDRRRAELRQTLDAWKKADLRAAAERALRYLPGEARIRASVYPMIKPKPNSFVFETSTDPAIFLYLDPAVPGPQFENTVAHELHHVGLASLSAAYDKRIQALPPNPRKVAEWLGAFGEGVAMLAAAGSPDVHPVADFPPSDRQRWDEDMKYFSNQQQELDQFFLDIIHDSYKNLEAADHQAFTFFGYRGPWYLVGYRMAVTIETQFGHAALVETLKDPRQFLTKYNQAAAASNAQGGERLPLFSDEILKAVGIESPAAKAEK